MKKLLITGAWQYTNEQYELLEKEYDICFVQEEKDNLPQQAYEAEIVVCNGLFLHHDIEKFKNLKCIQLTSAGFDRVPMDYVRENNIEIFNARGVYSIPMAEFALMGVLSIYKKSLFFSDNQKNHKWAKNRELTELFGKTVCIVGCGNVGTECAKRFSAFGTTILSVDLIDPNWEYGEEFYPIDKLEDALEKADVIVLTLPLTDETRHLFNKNVLGKMKKGAILVNIARGAVIDEEALKKVLFEERLSGAVLDVFENEPLSAGSALWDMENVIITPHNSFVSDANGKRLGEVIINNLKNWSK
ncbi:MAG: hydroxyacid dehydrogenase [Clostridia bacterium]|nr:hydroxyacid dehydrogenase [Clostridia bacterium]